MDAHSEQADKDIPRPNPQILSWCLMPIEHHPLIAEFPEHREAIHTLKMENAHFQRLMDSYENVDKEIVRMEEGIETPADEVLTALKKERLELKDQIAEMLRSVNA